MIKPRYKKIIKRTASAALTALMLFGSVYEAQQHTVNVKAASAKEDSSDEKEEDETLAEGAGVFKKGLGNVTFWKWTKQGPGNNSMSWDRFIFFTDKPSTYDYMGVKVPDDIFMHSGSHSSGSYEMDRRYADSDSDIAAYKGSSWSGGRYTIDSLYDHDNENVGLASADIVFITDRAYGYNYKDPMIHRDRNTFYTDDDRNAAYVKKVGNQQYQVAFAKDDKSKKYFIQICVIDKEDSKKNQAFFRIVPENEGSASVYVNGNARFCSSGSWEYRLGMSGGALHGAYVKYTWSDYASTVFTGYKGTQMHFSTLEGETTIKDQVFNITGGKYVDANGDQKETMGVIIQNGGKLVIDGGVVSVKANLINNGTIEIKNGGVLLVQDGGTVSSFLQGKDVNKNGCGKILCNNGDILIEKGGAVYGGMCESNKNQVPFYLDNNSTLVNCGLLVYGTMRLGSGARVECRNNSRTIGGVYPATLKEESGKCTITGYNGDYDMYCNYTKNIMAGSATDTALPSNLQRAAKSTNVGMVKANSSYKTTVLKYPKATVFDKAATDLNYITSYEGL